jgi:hypothetical protein
MINIVLLINKIHYTKMKIQTNHNKIKYKSNNYKNHKLKWNR